MSEIIHIRRPWAALVVEVYKCGVREFEPGKPRNKGTRSNERATCAGCIEAEARDRKNKKTRRINLEGPR